jgi:hypothetical protein
MAVSSVSSTSSATLLAARLRRAAVPPVERVSVVNGVIRSRVVQTAAPAGTTAVSPAPAVNGLGGTGILAGASPAALQMGMGFAGYEQRGSVAADLNPGAADMPTITVTARLIKGFKYSVGSSFGYLSTSKSATASLTVQGSADARAQALSLKSGTFTARATGDHTFTWTLSKGAKFNGDFSATVMGKEPTLPNSTGNKNVDALLQRQTAWWHDPGTLASVGTTAVMPGVMALSDASSRRVLSYSFISADAPPTDVLNNDFPGQGQIKQFAAMDARQQAAVQAALDYISSVTRLTFTEAKDGTGNIQLGAYNMDPGASGKSGLIGVSNLPGSYPLDDKVYTFLNSNPTVDLGDSSPGTLGWSTVWHEIGHALGLKHPGNYDAAGSRVSGPFMHPALDNRQYSIMSYKDSPDSPGAQNLSYMLYDVAALQYLYGVNPTGSTASGDVAGAGGRFSFSDTQQPWLSTLYSATGKDTVDLGNQVQGSLINLNAGSYSRIGYSSLAIAWGSRIDKVKLSTGAAADTVVLNAAFKRGGFNEVSNLKSQDRLALSKKVFGSLSARHVEIGTSSVAIGKKSRIVVNQSTGEIFYDADGAGSRHAAIKIAAYEAVQGVAVSARSFSFVA